MSTPQGQGCPPWGRTSNAFLRWGVVCSGLLALAPGQLLAQTSPSPHPGFYARPTSPFPSSAAPQVRMQPPREVIHAGGTWTPTTGPTIQQVQNTSESARAVHHLIEAMPTNQEDLDLIERRSQLIMTRANVVRMAIADQSILDVAQYSPRELSLIGLARGSTTLTLWFEGHPTPLIYLVKVIRDPNLDEQRRVDYGKLERKLAVLFPNSKVYLIPMSFKIIVRGQARDQEEAANILNIVRGEVINQDGSLLGNAAALGGAGMGGGMGDAGLNGGGLGWGNGLWAGFIVNELRVPGEFQINLRWRVAELNRSQARNFGIDLNVLFNNGRNVIGTAMGGVPGNLFGVFENGEIGVFINWLATNGTATILTEPNVTVLSGRPARFLAGGEFAVPTVVGIAGAAGQTTTFRGFGTSVLVTPTVMDRDLIRLSTIAEFSQINSDNAVQGIPGLSTRRVETTVELREGQTLALGGLLSHKKVTEVSRIPYLGDIPKIGPMLFSNKRSTMDETELLILVTPEIVRPMDAHEVPPVPGFEVTYPTDHEFWKYNMTEGMPDTGYYQVPPYGSGSVGTNVGYQHFNPGPANSLYSPVPTNAGGFNAPQEGRFTVPTAPGIPVTPDAQFTPGDLTPIPAAPAPSPETVPPPDAAAMMAPGSMESVSGVNYVPAQAGRGNQVQPAAWSAPTTAAPRPPARSGGPIPRGGWSAPSQPAASPQAIVPNNQTSAAAAKAGSAARNRRDQGQSNRY